MHQSTLLLNSNINININIRKSLKAKRVKVSINKQTLQTTLIIPKYQTIKTAKEFLFSKKDWIEKTLQKLKFINYNFNQQESQLRQKLDKLNKAEIHLLSLKLIQRCKFLADKYNFQTGKISVKNQKTLWGSCSSRCLIWI